jgi:hypothetical protein
MEKKSKIQIFLKKEKPVPKAWVIAVDMGYGHQRTAYPLRNLSPDGKVINANDYDGIPKGDRNIWEGTRKSYEFISNFKRIPLIGNLAFSAFDNFQRILSFYPKRDLSKPNFATKIAFTLFKKGWGKNLIEKLNNYNFSGLNSLKTQGKKRESLPLITTFFTPAFMAEYFNYSGDIFCVICDADINRAWAPLEPQKTKIKYFAPTERVVERLKLYGIKKENIFFTGYPLPMDIIGDEKMRILKEDLKYRILNLDPRKRYFQKYKNLIKENLGSLPKKSSHPLTIMFSVGGAGAQKEIGAKILKSLTPKIKVGQIRIILSIGVKEKIRKYFLENIKTLGLKSALGKNIEIVSGKDIVNYFQNFNEALRKTDVLWTKPSELSFYAALGLPIIISPTIGSQEDFNKRWLLKSGFGILQENPDYTNQWFFDWLQEGYFAEAAMQGFVEGQALGTLNIQKILSRY